MLDLKTGERLKIKVENDMYCVSLEDLDVGMEIGFKIPMSDINARNNPIQFILSRIQTLQFNLKTMRFGFLYGSGVNTLRRQK